jgi:hypothetical protein
VVGCIASATPHKTYLLGSGASMPRMSEGK